jgi:hypothetical protein
MKKGKHLREKKRKLPTRPVEKSIHIEITRLNSKKALFCWKRIKPIV